MKQVTLPNGLQTGQQGQRPSRLMATPKCPVAVSHAYLVGRTLEVEGETSKGEPAWTRETIRLLARRERHDECR